METNLFLKFYCTLTTKTSWSQRPNFLILPGKAVLQSPVCVESFPPRNGLFQKQFGCPLLLGVSDLVNLFFIFVHLMCLKFYIVKFQLVLCFLLFLSSESMQRVFAVNSKDMLQLWRLRVNVRHMHEEANRHHILRTLGCVVQNILHP